jgi:hypothetical protein
MYTLTQTTPTTWTLIKETEDDEEEYYLKINEKDNKVVCSCLYYSMIGQPCRHCRMLEEHLLTGVTKFDA